MFLGDRHPEDADPGELFNDRQRDQLVAAMPLLSMRRDLPFGEAAHLIANHLRASGSLDADIPECALSSLGGPRAPSCNRAAVAPAHRVPAAPVRNGAISPSSRPRSWGRANSPCAIADAAGELGEIFAIGGFKDNRLDLAELSAFVEPHRPVPHLAQRLDIARHPGQRMGGQLFGGEALGFDLAARRHPHDEPRPSGRKEQLCRAERRPVWASSAVRSVGTGCAMRRPISPAAIGSGAGRQCGPSGRRRT